MSIRSLLAIFLLLLGSVLPAHAQPERERVGDAADASTALAALWPPDCTRGLPIDGLVLIDGADEAAAGAWRVSVERTADGSAVAGALAAAPQDALPVRWQSDTQLAPDTEYRVDAQRLGASGEALGPHLTSRFTTGSERTAQLAFDGSAALRLVATAADDTQVLLRIAAPRLRGGLPFRPVKVTATFQDDPGAGAVEGRVAPGAALGLELPVALRDEPVRRCVVLRAQDDLGHVALAEPVCEQVPARAPSNVPSLAEPAAGVLYAEPPAHSDTDPSNADNSGADASSDDGPRNAAWRAGVEADGGGCNLASGPLQLHGVGLLGLLWALPRVSRVRRRTKRA